MNGAGGSVRVDYFARGDLLGTPLRTETLPETMAVWLGEPAPGVPPGDFSARLQAAFVPDRSGTWTLSVSGVGAGRLFLDGELLADTTGAASGAGLMGLFTTPVESRVILVAGTTYELVAELDADEAEGPIALAGITIEARPPTQPDAVARAVQAASVADVAIVVVGQNDRETEGLDATSMDLPDDQVALIREIAVANPRTVVVVNAASPVTMDWADDVAAVVQMSYLGQETGSALAAVLFGDADASGRLTTTYPKRLEDAPAFSHFPGGDGTVEYAEGLLVGYRHYDTNGIEPRWCFGHGLSYTTFAYTNLSVADDDRSVAVSIDVTNTGDRAGSDVLQAYVRPGYAPVLRPERELKAFEKITLEPGQTTTVTVTLDPRAFSYWEPTRQEWVEPSGTYEILVGSSSRAIHQTARWTRS